MKRKFEFFAIVDETKCSIIKRYPSHNSTFEQSYPNSAYEHIPDDEYTWDRSEEYGPYCTEEEAWASAHRIRDRIQDEMNDEYDEW